MIHIVDRQRSKKLSWVASDLQFKHRILTSILAKVFLRNLNSLHTDSPLICGCIQVRKDLLEIQICISHWDVLDPTDNWFSPPEQLPLCRSRSPEVFLSPMHSCDNKCLNRTWIINLWSQEKLETIFSWLENLDLRVVLARSRVDWAALVMLHTAYIGFMICRIEMIMMSTAHWTGWEITWIYSNSMMAIMLMTRPCSKQQHQRQQWRCPLSRSLGEAHRRRPSCRIFDSLIIIVIAIEIFIRIIIDSTWGQPPGWCPCKGWWRKDLGKALLLIPISQKQYWQLPIC